MFPKYTWIKYFKASESYIRLKYFNLLINVEYCGVTSRALFFSYDIYQPFTNPKKEKKKKMTHIICIG